MIRRMFVVAIIAVACLLSQVSRAADPLSLRDGDRVMLLGGTFWERMQSHGYLETLLTTAYPHRNITFRNLGWSGDTVFGDARAVFGSRADGFKRLMKDLTEAKPTVILVGYGENEAFRGSAGLEEFSGGLNRLLDALSATKARIVLLTPRRREKPVPPLPDPAAYNDDLQQYSTAIGQVARQRNLPVVDLSDLGEDQRLTENGIHLSPYGYWRAAPQIAQRLGASPRRWSIDLDAVSGVYDAVGAALSEVDSSPSGVRFVALDRRLPLPATPEHWRKNAAGDNAPRLRITNLAPGKYRLLVDGKQAATLNHQQLAAGIVWHGGPAQNQVQALRKEIYEKNVLYFHRYRPQNETYLFLFRKHEQGNNAVEIPMFDPLIEKREQRIAELRKPRPHRYQLQRVE